jgi:tRNA U38,U39,U40 pseudouridine synthase TruA
MSSMLCCIDYFSLIDNNDCISQIRLMVGAALLVARGILPLTAVDFALAAPIQLVLPLAPAEGLTLMYSGYLRNINGQVRLYAAILNTVSW